MFFLLVSDNAFGCLLDQSVSVAAVIGVKMVKTYAEVPKAASAVAASHHEHQTCCSAETRLRQWDINCWSLSPSQVFDFRTARKSP